MSIIEHRTLTGPAAWRGADLATDTRWIRHWSADEIAALDAALAHMSVKDAATFVSQDLKIARKIAYRIALARQQE